MAESVDTGDLLARAARGDDDAWREIVARYQRLVYATVWGFRLAPEDAEDVFQETFLRLHRHAARLRNPAGLARWIALTARRLCLDHLERRRVRGEIQMADDYIDPAPEASEQLERLERAQAIREALALLSPRCRVLLEHLYFRAEPLSYRDIARVLDMPVGSIGPTRARCLESLLRKLEQAPAGISAGDSGVRSGSRPIGGAP